MTQTKLFNHRHWLMTAWLIVLLGLTVSVAYATWTAQTVDNTGNVGQYNSLAEVAGNPATDFTGTDTFTHTISDGDLTDSTTVALTANEGGGSCVNIEQPLRTAFSTDANSSYASAGQSFTAPTDANETFGITAHFGFIEADSTITLNLYNGPASGNIDTPIATATHTNSGPRVDAPIGSDLAIYFEFASPVSLTPGNEYYYLLSPSFDPVAFSYAFADGNPYTEGSALSGFSNGTVGSWSYDLKFTVHLCEETANSAPIAEDDTAVTLINTPVNIDVLANDSDPEDDALTITAVTDPTNGTAVISSTQVIYTPTTDFTGTDVFSYTISDGDLTDSATVTVTVNEGGGICDVKNGVVEQLIANSTVSHANSIYASMGQSFTAPQGVTTIDGVTAYFSFIAENAAITLNLYNGPATGNISAPIATASHTHVGEAIWAPNIEGIETHFRFDIPVALTPGNEYYFLMSPSFDPVSFGAAFADGNPYGDGDALNGMSDGMLTYLLFQQDAYDLKFSIFLCDGAANTAPIAVDDTAVTLINTPVNIDVLANDSDPEDDALTITAVTDPTNGTAVISSTQVTYTPATDFTGTDTFTYTISDGDLTDTATVTVTVNEPVAHIVYLPLVVRP
jgi:large repetitive protein